MKVRNGFVSNSSSSSFVVYPNDYAINDIPRLDEFDNYTVGNIGETEFGWGPEDVHGVHSRINFALLQAEYSKKPEWMEMLETAIKEVTGAKEVHFDVTSDYKLARTLKIKDGYIDHQSAASEGQNIEMFKDLKTLKNFLFNKKVYIRLDNDNY